jgi:hypothetical protein
MRLRVIFRVSAVLLALALVLPVQAKEKIFTMPRMFHAKTYPAHDAHTDESLTIAADPYDMPDKQKTVFVTDYKSRDLLPIHVVVTNDDPKQAVNLSEMKVTLITKGRSRIYPADSDDIYRRIGRQIRRGDEPPKVQLPIPLPRKGPGKSVSDEAKAEVEGSQFLARAVEPNASQGGFFYFDVSGIENPLAGARLVVTGLKKGGQELFYFEIPMEKYLGYDPLKLKTTN